MQVSYQGECMKQQNCTCREILIARIKQVHNAQYVTLDNELLHWGYKALTAQGELAKRWTWGAEQFKYCPQCGAELHLED